MNYGFKNQQAGFIPFKKSRPKVAEATRFPRGRSRTGFTLVEMLLVIGIITAIFGVGLVASMDFYQSYSLNYETNLVVGIIQRARSQAMANTNQAKHGVCLIGSDYVIFEGDTCASGDTFPKSSAIDVDWQTPVIFNQLDGTCEACPLIITMGGLGRASLSIIINNEGQIDW